jgi:hypothetical protein
VQDGNAAPSIYGLRFNVSTVPEPGTVTLMLTGLASLRFFARGRRTSRS